ncbi:hypothetical protein BKA83DRAFT_4492158 [Pisolithus microcarpus]|nr:hypothetical protein BKA83DRAFT_4492158 [Pisolithus microcarpus]
MSSNTNTITNNSMQLVEDNNITNNMVVIEESNNTNNMQVVIEDTNTSNMQCDDNSTDKNNNNHPTTADQGMEMSVVENKEESTKENDKDIILLKAQDQSGPATTKSSKGKLSAKSKARISACLKQLMPDPSMGPSVAEELAAVINSAGDQQQSVLAMHKKAKKSIKSRAQGSQDKIQMEVQGNVAAVKRGLEPDSEEEVTGEMARNTTDATEMQSKYKCSKHARDQDQSMARREPVLVVNRVREMAVVQQENEQEACGPKVKDKGKAKATEASLACHLQPEDDMEEQGAQVQPRRRQSLFPRGDNLIPNIKVTEPTEADELKFAVETAIADVTLGYALMTVIHDQADQRCDLNRGPILKLREYNPRPINDKYLAQLKKSIGARGLQSKVIWNAMILAVPCSSIDSSSLKPLKLGTYENKVIWTSQAGASEASFLNGNHRREVLKLMDMKATHVQYRKALQEKAKATKMEEHQQYLLDEAISGLEKELDKSGSWLVQFVDKDKLASHPQRMWLLDQLTSNSPMIALPDNDNDKLYQVLNILSTLDEEQQAEYLKETQILLCKYILDVFTFLAAPVEVKILGLTIDAAEKEEKDVEKQCRKVARAMMAEARASTYFAWGLVDDFAEKSLMIWADVMKSSKHDHPWRLWGLKDRASRELWNNLLDKYWRRLLSEGMSMGHEIQVNKDTSPDDRIQVAFKNKLEWVRGGHLLDTTYPLSFGSMPLGNRLMFNNIQRLFTDLTSTPKLDLSLAIKEVVSWVEPFVTLSSMQRGDRVWRDYMRAMTANMMRVVTDFFITERPKLQVFTKYLASVQEQVKVYDASNLHTELLEKKFLERLQKIINQYHEQVESWSRATPVPTYLRPEPNQTVSFENLTEQQEKVAQGIIQMMRVTAFPKDHYKGMEQLVKALAPMTLNEASRQLLLATEVGWALRHKLANIMQGCRGAQQHWVWYDGIQDRPYCKNGLDASDEMSCMDIGETRDNWANRITMESELFAQNKRKVKELQKILFSNQLGLLNNGALPEDLWLAADTMLKCIVRESERHIGRLSIPLQDIMGVDWTDQALEDYGVKMPPMATQNEVKMYWGVKQGADLEPLRNIGTFKQTDKQMVNMECIASAKVKRKEEKEIKEVEKATLFVPRDRESVKLQAKMARLKKKEAEEKANCQVADFDKRMVEEEQQQQQVLSAGPYKRTGENLRALKFSKVKRGHKRAKSSESRESSAQVNEGQAELGEDSEQIEEDESGDMDVDDMSKQQQQSSEPEGDNTSSSSEVVARNKRLYHKRPVLPPKPKSNCRKVHYSKEEFQVHQMVKNFVSTEAKLSRGNPSSDESEDTEDGYEAAFIDDSTQKGQESSEENESKATAEATDSSDDSDTDIDGSEEGDGKSMEDISQLPKNDGNGGRELTEIDTSTDSSQDDGYGTSLINTMTRVPESMLKECQEVDAEGISQRMSHFSMDAEGQDK